MAGASRKREGPRDLGAGLKSEKLPPMGTSGAAEVPASLLRAGGRKRRVAVNKRIMNHNKNKWASNRRVLRLWSGPVRAPE